VQSRSTSHDRAALGDGVSWPIFGLPAPGHKSKLGESALEDATPPLAEVRSYLRGADQRSFIFQSASDLQAFSIG
jgi:hypothetical protein